MADQLSALIRPMLLRILGLPKTMAQVTKSVLDARDTRLSAGVMLSMRSALVKHTCRLCGLSSVPSGRWIF